MNYRAEGNILKSKTPEGWQDLYVFPAEIYEVYQYPIGLVIVLGSSDRNVFLVNPSGELIWRIGEATTSALIENGKVTAVPDPFTYLAWNNGRLTAQTQTGFQYEVNSSNGTLTQTGWIKS